MLLANRKQAAIHIWGAADSGKSAVFKSAALLYPKIGYYTPDGGAFPFNGMYCHT